MSSFFSRYNSRSLQQIGYAKNEYRRYLLAFLLLSHSISYASAVDLMLSSPAFDSQIALKANSKFGGAVYSLVFRGKEHLDRRDHGRLLQSASSFDGFGECYNPTEGGASSESNNEEASVLKAACVEGNQLRTTTAMAFFLGPGQVYPRGCGSKRKYLKKAVNKVATSNHVLEKRLTVGLPDFPNVIEHQVTFHVPSVFSHAVFEASTAYVPKDFSGAIYFDPVRNMEIDPGDHQGEQILPVILFTPDKRHAIGVYSPQLPQKGLKVGYGRFTFPDVNKWNCVFRENNVTPGAYEYQCLVVLGTLDEIEDTMRRLSEHYAQ